MPSTLHHYTVPVAAVSLTAATAKTVVQLVTGSTRAARLTSFTAAFQSTTSTDTPVLVVIQLQTTAGTMSAATPQPTDGRMAAAISTAQTNATAEPTAGNTIHRFRLTPIGGLLHLPLEHLNIVAQVSTRIGITLTAAQSQTFDGTLAFEE